MLKIITPITIVKDNYGEYSAELKEESGIKLRAEIKQIVFVPGPRSVFSLYVYPQESTDAYSMAEFSTPHKASAELLISCLEKCLRYDVEAIYDKYLI